MPSAEASWLTLTRRLWRLLLTAALTVLLGWAVEVPAASAAAAHGHPAPAHAAAVGHAPTRHNSPPAAPRAATSGTSPRAGSAGVRHPAVSARNSDSCTDITGSVTVPDDETFTCITVEPGATLAVGNDVSCGQEAPITLTLTDGGTIDAGGTLALYGAGTCDTAADSTLDVSGGTLVNNGTLATEWAGPFNPPDNGGDRYLEGSFTNNGTTIINDRTYLEGPGTFKNAGTFHLVTTDQGWESCDKGSVLAPGSGVTFNNTATGTIESDGLSSGCDNNYTAGLITLTGGNTFIEAGSITSGSGNPVLLQGDTLHYTGSGPGTVEVQGSTTLSGNLAAGQTLQLDGSSGLCQITSAAVTAAAGFTNAGAITGGCGGGPVSLAVTSGTLTNSGTIAPSPAGLNLSGNVQNTGTVSVGGSQTLTYTGGTFTNNGAVQVDAPGGAFTVASGTPAATFANTRKGSITNSGQFTMNGGNTFDEAGTITGTNPVLSGDTLNYTGTGASTVEVQGSTTLSGSIGKRQTLVLDTPSGFCQIPAQTVTAASGFTNSGDITTGCGNNGGATLNVNAGTLVNEGTLGGGNAGSIAINGTVDNSGTINAGYQQSITISNLANYDPTTQVLTGGTYVTNVADVNSRIVVPGMNIATNDATIDLGCSCGLSNGSGYSLSSLSDNGGILDFAQLGNFTLNVGSLTNSGTIGLGENNNLNVSGSYTQTATGVLSAVVAGTSATHNYGQMEVSGEATFAGTLVITKDSSYTPSAGDTQQIVTYSSQSGQFAAVKGTTAAKGLDFVLQYTPSAAELVVTHTALTVSPVTGAAGATVQLTGNGFSPGETVTLSFEDAAGTVTSFTPVTAGSSGGFTVTEAVPEGAASGAGTFQAAGQTSGVIKTAKFTVS